VAQQNEREDDNDDDADDEEDDDDDDDNDTTWTMEGSGKCTRRALGHCIQPPPHTQART
jgi:hypothetical protein